MLFGRALCVHVAVLLFSVVIVASPAAAAAPANCEHADSAPGAASPEQLGAATLCLVNAERAAAGQQPLAANATLERTGRSYATESVATQHFAHADARGGSVADRVLAVGGTLDPWLELGENLGWGTLDQASPQAIVTGWMNSPTHRDNILYTRFTRLGVGVVEGVPAADRTGGATYVAVFGRTAPRKPAKPKRCTRSRMKTRAARAACRRANARAARAARA